VSRKRQTTEPEPPPTSLSSSRSDGTCLSCGKPREIGDSCRACYLLMSARMAQTVKDEPHLITILTNNQEDIQP